MNVVDTLPAASEEPDEHVDDERDAVELRVPCRRVEMRSRLHVVRQRPWLLVGRASSERAELGVRRRDQVGPWPEATLGVGASLSG